MVSMLMEAQMILRNKALSELETVRSYLLEKSRSALKVKTRGGELQTASKLFRLVLVAGLLLSIFSMRPLSAQTSVEAIGESEAEAAARRPARLRKLVVLSPALNKNDPGSILYHYNPPQPDSPVPSEVGQLNQDSNVALLKNSGTTWVRLWASWSSLQPLEEIDLRDPTSPNYIENDCRTKALIQNLDEQIRVARKEGFNVILTAWLYPTWVNGGAAPTPKPGSPCELESKFEYLTRLPRTLTAGSPWARWIDFLMRRYGYSQATKEIQPAGRYVEFLEIVNEPNGTGPAHKNSSGEWVTPSRVARMFKTSQDLLVQRNSELGGELDAQHRTTIRLAGPALVDSTNEFGGKIMPYQVFTGLLLKRLDALNFNNRDTNFAWSQHNYGDVNFNRLCARDDKECKHRESGKKDEECTAPYTKYCVKLKRKCPLGDTQCLVNAASWVSQTLEKGVGGFRWQGWPSRSNPQILITEGGAIMDRIAANQAFKGEPTGCERNPDPDLTQCHFSARNIQTMLRLQSELVTANFRLMNDEPHGKDVWMVSNYLTYTDPCFDSGLLGIDGIERDWIARQRTSCKEWIDKDNPPPAIFPFTTGGSSRRPVYFSWSKLLGRP
jgi:hypothetical protein